MCEVMACVATGMLNRPHELAEAPESDAKNESGPLDGRKLDAILSSVSVCIDWLHRLSNMLRQPSLYQNYGAGSTIHADDTGSDDVTLELMQRFQDLILRDFPSASQDLCNRLASTMVVRHKQILYRRNRLSEHKLQPKQAQVTTNAAHLSSMSSSFIPSGVFQERTSFAQDATMLRQSDMSRSVASTPTDLDKTESSEQLSSNNDLAIPPPPQLALDAEEIVCPYCGLTLPAGEVRDTTAWAVHVARDSDPYVCLLFPCEKEHHLFITRAEWIGHMKQTHLTHWPCLAKSHKRLEFPSQEDYIAHMREDHSGEFSDDLLPFIAQSSRRMPKDVFETCPLCGDERMGKGKQLEDHISHHLLYLALLSLPPLEDTGDEIMSESARRADVKEGKKKSETSDVPQRLSSILSRQTTTPSVQNSLWMVPYERNTVFTGHANIIEDLLWKLRPGGGPNTTDVLIAGHRGIGKTALAVELLYRMREVYDDDCSYLWVSSSTRQTVEHAYSEIARRLGILPRGYRTPRQLETVVHDYLGSKTSGWWVLVYDDMSELPHDLPDSLLRIGRGSIIVTSNNLTYMTLRNKSFSFQLPELDKTSCLFLLHNLIPIHPAMDDAADDLVLNLMYEPLAIVQAAAYIMQEKISIGSYLNVLRGCVHRRFNTFDFLVGSQPRPWVALYDQAIRRRSTLESKYLFFMTCTLHDDIPRSLLAPDPSQKEKDDALSRLQANACIEAYSAGSLIKVHFELYVGLQEWLRSNGYLDYWLDQVMERIAALLPENTYELARAGEWRAYLPHVDYTLSLLQPTRKHRSVHLLWKLGLCLYHDRQYDAAQTRLASVVALREKTLGPDVPATLESITKLAETHEALGEIEKAIELQELVLERRRKRLPRNHPDTLGSTKEPALTNAERRLQDEVKGIDRRIRNALNAVSMVGASTHKKHTHANETVLDNTQEGWYPYEEDSF